MSRKEELIGKYLQGGLSEAEKEEFDGLMVEDSQMKAEVEFQMNLQKVTRQEDSHDFRSLIKGFESKGPKSRNVTIKWLAAAGIVLLLGMGYFFNYNKKVDTTQLFKTHYEPYRNVIMPIERGTTTKNIKAVAFETYENGNYEKALTLFTDLHSKTGEPYYLFYKANSLLQLQRAEEAVPILQAHLKSEDALTDKTHWYLALAYLKLNKNEEAREALNELIKKNSFKVDEAQELLEQLD